MPFSLFNSQTWQPAYWYAPNGSVAANTASWVLNPFNPDTPINNVYEINNSILSLSLQQVPTGLNQACGGQAYVSGAVNTQAGFRQQYGYFEAEIAVNLVQGAYYMFSLMTDVQSPPEIDVTLYYPPGGSSWVCQFGVWDAKNVNSYLPQNNWLSSTNQTYENLNILNFHKYGIYWQPTSMTFYIDHCEVFQCTSPTGYNYTMFPVLAINCGSIGSAMGPLISPTSLPATMQIESVQVYKYLPF